MNYTATDRAAAKIPTALPVRVENIPVELRTGIRYVVWKHQLKTQPDGTEVWKKPPYDPRTSYPASVTDPATWGSFDEAVAAYKTGSYDGIGCVLTHAGGYVVVDVDEGRNPISGEVTEDAGRTVSRMATYTELSPSGCGFHIFGKGKLPPNGRRIGNIEMYDSARFITLTGHHVLETPTTLEDRQGEIDALHAELFPPRPPRPIQTDDNHSGDRPWPKLTDDEIRYKLEHAANANKFRPLWAGQWRGVLDADGKPYKSQSEAEGGLCGIIGFYTRNVEQIDRLMRRSGLAREKWLERPDYAEETIRGALAKLTRFYGDTTGLPARDDTDEGEDDSTARHGVLVRLDSVQPETVHWLWPKRFPLGKLSIIDGDPGLGKSTLMLDIAARVSRGTSMPDGTASDLDGPASVIVLSLEDGLADTVVPRLMVAGAALSKITALEGVAERDAEGQRLFAIPDDVDVLEDAITETGAKLVIIDPVVGYFAAGINSHKDQDVRRALGPLAKMAERTGAAIIVVRHMNKNTASGVNPLYRGGGSIGIIGAARSGLLVAKDPKDATGERIVLASTKSNLGPKPEALAFRVIGVHHDGKQASTGAKDSVARIDWLGASEQTAEGLLTPTTAAGQRRTAFVEGVEFLGSELADGEVKVLDLQMAAKKAGIAWRTVQRAQKHLPIVPKRYGKAPTAYWTWRLTEIRSGGRIVPWRGAAQGDLKVEADPVHPVDATDPEARPPT